MTSRPLGLLLCAVPALVAGDLPLFQRYLGQEGRIRQARIAVAAHRFDEAGRLLEACLRAVPGHAEAHFLMARMAYEGRDHAGALAHLDASDRSLADLDRRYREELAGLQAQAEAEEAAMRTSLSELSARIADPTGCAAPLLVGKQHALDYLEARKGQLHRRDDPFGIPAEQRLLRGNCLYRLGRRAEALAQYRLAAQADPALAAAWTNLIALHLELGEPGRARAALGEAEAAGVRVRADLRRAVAGD